MKTKVMIGLATLAAMVLPAMAQAQEARFYRNGDRPACVTSYNNGYANYEYDGGAYYRGRDRDDYLRRHQYQERERREHERRESREHRDGFYR